MSRKLTLSIADGIGFEASIDGATIILTELRVQSNSNWKYPFKLLGKGGASLILTDENLLELTGEYLRYVLCRNEETQVNFHKHTVGFDFSCVCERPMGEETSEDRKKIEKTVYLKQRRKSE